MSRRIAATAACLLCIVACSNGEPEIPVPDLEAVEPDVREAVETAVAAVRANPASAEAWGRLGDRYRAQQWWFYAANCYVTAERLEPSNFLWPYRRAKALQYHDPAAAAESFTRAVEIDPDYAPARLHFGEALIALGEPALARGQLEAAASLDPASATPVLRLGQLALGDGDQETARALLERALELDSSDGRIHVALSQVLLALGETELASKYAEAGRRTLKKPTVSDPRGAVSVPVTGSWGLARSGRSLMTEGRVEEAVPVLQESVRLHPDRFAARLNLGLALMTLQRPAEAEEHLRHAVWLNPAHATARSAFGGALLSRGAADEAVEHLRMALRLDPEDVRSHVLLGQALVVRGDANGVRELERAVAAARAAGEESMAAFAERWLRERRR